MFLAVSFIETLDIALVLWTLLEIKNYKKNDNTLIYP